jgi:polysaccharide export outer membrane protein
MASFLGAVIGSGCASVCPQITKAEGEAFMAVRPEEGGYVIQPGDQLAVEVWQNAQLTRSVNVRPDGKITLPLVNDVPAANETVPQFQANLTTRLKTYLKDPIVSVTVTSFSAKQIYMQGQIASPAAYAFRGDMYLLQAIATAGGASAFAEGGAVVVRRKGDQFLRYCVELEPLLSGKSMKENIKLLPNDVVTIK